MSSGKSISLSDAAIEWANQFAAKERLKFSRAVNRIILQHRDLTPGIRKQEALTQLRNAAAALALEHNLAEDAVLSWAKKAMGGKQ